MNALAREYHDTHDLEIPEEIYRLARLLIDWITDGVGLRPSRLNRQGFVFDTGLKTQALRRGSSTIRQIR